MIKWLDDNFEETAMIILLSAMTIVMGIQICSRYVFGYSLSWSEEITRYLFIWSAFLSLGYCIKKGISIKIEQFINIYSEKEKKYIKIINYFLEISMFIYLIPFSITYLYGSISGGQISPALGIPMYMVQSAPLVGFTLGFIRVIQRIIKDYNLLGKGAIL